MSNFTEDLSPKTLGILAAIMDANGQPPSIRQLGEQFGIKSPNGVMWHLNRLQRLGLIRHETRKARTLVPTCRFDSSCIPPTS